MLKPDGQTIATTPSQVPVGAVIIDADGVIWHYIGGRPRGFDWRFLVRGWGSRVFFNNDFYEEHSVLFPVTILAQES